MKLKVAPASRLMGTVRPPGDKSITQRALILGGLARGVTEVHGWLRAGDSLATLAAVQALGVEAEDQGETLMLRGVGPAGFREPSSILDLQNSGTGLRLLAGALAGQPVFSVLTGDASLRRRPMDRIVAPLRQMGAQIWGRAAGRLPPLAIAGGPLTAIRYQLPIASAQVKSALLFAALAASGETQVIEPLRTRDHTERLLRQFGVSTETRELVVSLTGPAEPVGCRIEVPGDFSAAAAFLTAGCLMEEVSLTIRHVGVNPLRTGLLDVLVAMGARIEQTGLRDVSGEPVADLTVHTSRLVGTTVKGEMIPRLIDELPLLAVAAACAEGETIVAEAQELRMKETDRVLAMAVELARLGVAIEERPDGWRITGRRVPRASGGRVLKGAVCQSHGDHRVAMALAVAGLMADGETVIEDAGWIATSFPDFMDAFRGIGATLEAAA